MPDPQHSIDGSCHFTQHSCTDPDDVTPITMLRFHAKLFGALLSREFE